MNFIRYDINGNLYLKKDDDIYMVDINKDDEIIFEKINKNNFKLNTNLTEFNKKKNKPIFKQNVLHIKTIENAIKELNEENDDDEKDKFDDIYDKYKSYMYNPEQRYYHDNWSDNGSDNESDNKSDEDKIIKGYGGYEEGLIDDIYFDIPSYEILIIDDINFMSGNQLTNNLVYRTEILNDQALYRITIHSSGIIYLNIIGSKINTYKYDISNMSIAKINTDNVKIY
jgi:hypothetical protein